MVGPDWVRLGNELSNVCPRTSFSGLAGVANQYGKQIQPMAVGLCLPVRALSDHIADRHKKLDQERRGVAFGMRSDRAYEFTRQTVMCFCQEWFRPTRVCADRCHFASAK